MKLYGFAYAVKFPCICFGKRVWHFKLVWVSRMKRFRWYSWWDDAESVWYQRVNSYPFKFFGVMILPNENVYDLNYE